MNTAIRPPDDRGRQLETPIGMQETQTPPPAVAPFDAKRAKALQMAWAKYLKTPVETTNSIGMKLVLLPPGEFDMGSSQEEVDRFLAEARQQKTDFEWQVREAPTEVPKRRIRITTPCYVGKCEVTMGQFAQFVAATGYVTFAERVANGEMQAGPDGVWRRGDTWRKSGENWIGGQTQNHPVIIVTWNDADAFCQWLSSKENRSHRIPTEAEWEYACRAGTATRFPSGEAVASISGYAHMRIGAGDMGFLPVGRLRANAISLHDMLGNVAELCQIIATQPDSSSPSTIIVDPKEPPGTSIAVAKGCGLSGSSARISGWGKSDRPNGNVGFRVIQVITDLLPSEAQSAK